MSEFGPGRLVVHLASIQARAVRRTDPDGPITGHCIRKTT